jgi:hypothetical protein
MNWYTPGFPGSREMIDFGSNAIIKTNHKIKDNNWYLIFHPLLIPPKGGRYLYYFIVIQLFDTVFSRSAECRKAAEGLNHIYQDLTQQIKVPG